MYLSFNFVNGRNVWNIIWNIPKIVGENHSNSIEVIVVRFQMQILYSASAEFPCSNIGLKRKQWRKRIR